jgi:hypothetical protein
MQLYKLALYPFLLVKFKHRETEKAQSTQEKVEIIESKNIKIRNIKT